MLAGLQARGLVSRGPDPSNRRAYLVSLMPAGDQLRAQAAEVLADCDQRFLAPLTPDQRARLRSDLQQLL